MRLTFLGANRQVTGSRTLLENGGRFLVDCGMFQERESLDRNWEPFPFEPAELTACLLTHAHLDHCGLLPRLAREGFPGPVLATSATAELARIVLLDSAHIQEEDAAYKKKRHAKEGRRGPHPEIPLYTVEDAENTLPLFRPAGYGRPMALSGSVRATFHDAGHILGSAMLEVAAGEGKEQRTIIFSGDIGQWGKPLVRDPSVFENADYVVMESTYGDREHEDEGAVDAALARVINETAARGGNLIIPVFALERAQEVLFFLSLLVCEKRIPRMPVFLDSPMAVEVTGLFERYKNFLDEDARARLRSDCPPFAFPGLRFMRTSEESKTINGLRTPCIILAGSGMANAGRIKHHLVAHIERPESTVLFVGYQARGTLGSLILEGKPVVRILGRELRVRARVVQIQGFSGHAGRADLLRWLRAFRRPPRRLFLCHGEENAAEVLARQVQREFGWPVSVPRTKDVFEL